MSKTTKPIIGLAGGIGSGKSTVARLMGGLGGCVIDADALAQKVLDQREVCRQLRDRWGPEVLDNDGRVNRRYVSSRVFDTPAERKWLEGLIHPMVEADRQKRIQIAMDDPNIRFIVLDVPLLMEVGLDARCDKVVFVDTDRKIRLERVQRTRGWNETELARREKNQWPLDRKMAAAHAIIKNNGDEAQCLSQIRGVLDQFFPNP